MSFKYEPPTEGKFAPSAPDPLGMGPVSASTVEQADDGVATEPQATVQTAPVVREPVKAQAPVVREPVKAQVQLVQSSGPGQTAPPVSDQTAMLLEILIKQQARLALADQREEEARLARDKQRAKNAQDHTAKDLLRQARCTHLKGGKKGPRSQVRDYAVSLHTYIDNHHEIRCFICKMVWKVNDTAEFLIRRGKKVANHTKMGWYEASKLLEQTTNTPSSSEIPLQAQPAAAALLDVE